MLNHTDAEHNRVIVDAEVLQQYLVGVEIVGVENRG